MSLDARWFLDVNRFANDTPWLHWFFAPYALWGGPVLLVLLVALGYWRARSCPDALRQVATAVLTGVSAIVAVLISQRILSPLIARERPCHALTGVHTLLACNSDYSMPSDHCMIAGAMAAGLWMLGRALGVVGTVAALLLAFARVYVGVHYPSDVVVGLIVGAAVTCLLVPLLRTPTTRLAGRLADTRLRPLLVAPLPPDREPSGAGRSA